MIDYNFYQRFDTATTAWEALFAHLCNLAQRAENTETSRDGAVAAELVNACIVITDPTRGIVTSKRRNMPMRYAVGELLWYLSGSNKTRDIAQYSDFWEKISDDGEHANSAYGHRIFHHYYFDQWEYVKDLLIFDQNSRQAVIHIKDANDRPTKDTPCTLTLQFLIREGKLHLAVNMRSNDIWLGFPFDVFAFTALQIKMAFELGVEIGTYTHFAGSLHLYDRDYQAFLKKE